ncbi:MAG: hypothetical protein QS748_07165 [Candidatus Endonucleobacter bathymodioli]|uniref:Uncharacterized protein n=1 Tax=Candidatus Endonucleibacter bathymodioli TaxID=539814 RepID=A0AA90NLQ6_9GAMM|nr:hypothetical protein [Candidatus Endonucleobacter bathymodioli]
MENQLSVGDSKCDNKHRQTCKVKLLEWMEALGPWKTDGVNYRGADKRDELKDIDVN